MRSEGKENIKEERKKEKGKMEEKGRAKVKGIIRGVGWWKKDRGKEEEGKGNRK